MKKYTQLLNQEIAEALKLLGAPGAFPPVEEIEQLSGSVFLQYNEKAPEGRRHALLFSLSVLRTTQEFDWKKLIDSIAPKQTEIPIEGKICYKALLKDLKNSEVLCEYLGLLPIASDSQGEKSICFLLPDNRTLIMGSEGQFKEMLASQNRKPAWATSAAWRRVERGLFAVAIDNRDHCLAKAWGKADENWMQAPGLRVITEKAGSVVFGVDNDGEFKFDAFGVCRNQNDTEAVANAASDLVTRAIEALDTPMAKDPAGQQLPWLKKLLAQCGVGLETVSESEREPTVAHLHAHVKAEFAELFESLGDAKAEVKPTEPSKP